jgi:hypothetical protein
MTDLPNLLSRSAPLLPCTPTPSNRPAKHSRAPTMTDVGAMLPPHRRQPKKTPLLKPLTAYMFAGLYPLYRREVIHEDHKMMTIYCTQPGC